MRNGLLLTVVGAVLVAVGAVWGLQGVGIIGGSFMSGNSLWAIIGPIVAAVGLLTMAFGVRRGRSARE